MKLNLGKTPAIRRSTLALAAATLLPLSFAVTACGEDEPDTDTTSEESSAAETEEATDATAEESDDATEEESDDDAAGTGDYTEPGTELSIGDAATVPYTDSDATGDLEITVTEIEEGAASDLKDVENAEDAVPYYLHLSVTGGADADNLAGVMLSDVTGLVENDGRAGTLITMGGFEPCDKEALPEDFAEGETFETCIPSLGTAEAPVVAAQFAQDDSDYDSYEGEPVVWRS